MSVKLSTESAIVVPDKYREQYGISVLPLHILYGEECFDDAVSITTGDILQRYADTGALPTTSACSIGEYEEYFRALTADGSDVVHFAMSSGISSTYRNACLAAETMDNVYVVDTMNITSGAGILVIKAAEMMEKGFSAKEIVRKTEERKKRVRSSFIIDTLDFLRKGGRCSGIVAFGANILGIKPTIDVRDGTMQVGKKFRGKYDMCIQKYVDYIFETGGTPQPARVFIEHSPGISPEQVELIKKEIRKYCKFDEVLEVETSSTIVAHCGPGTVGVMFIED
ncbi:MAG: DegV family protein [Clostridia bacterium]|nr:DegV family protein [Clostridia bacterium]